jgi:hypothetical protein
MDDADEGDGAAYRDDADEGDGSAGAGSGGGTTGASVRTGSGAAGTGFQTRLDVQVLAMSYRKEYMLGALSYWASLHLLKAFFALQL